MSFSSSASQTLNLAQQEAVNYLHGGCLVLAGAGSGKTRVITHKIARLIQAGLPPQRIVAITFTNKAAAEMRERSKALVGKPARELRVCTFHALGVQLLREDAAAIGLKPQFSVLDSEDVLSLLKDVAASTDRAQLRRWQWAISRWKNQGLNAAQALAQADSADERATAQIMARFEERLQAYQSVDFDDLIGLPLKLLREHASVRAKWQQRMGHILIDEYQDTNVTQYELFKLLLPAQPGAARFTAVGDDDQSIYGWRGATLDNLKRLPLDFAQLKVIKLEQNYRSTGAILQAANRVISLNPKLFPKRLWSELGEGEPVRVLDADNEEHEAERVVARIQSLRATSPYKEFKDFAVLYRANHQAKVFEQALRKAQLPYKVSGGLSYFDRTEIRDLCAWLRLWINDDDDPAFLRAVSTPKRGVGHHSLSQLAAYAQQYKLSLFEAIFSSPLSLVLNARALGSLQEFARDINDLAYRARHTQGAQAAQLFLADWLKEIGYEQHLYDSEAQERVAAQRWANVLDFCDWMAKRCGGEIDDSAGGLPQLDAQKSLLEVAQTVSLLSTLNEREREQNVITLSTLHAAKGLEWPHVMLVGVSEGMLPFKPGPHSEALADEADSPVEASAGEGDDQTQRLQEERRLMYVGITRAQRSLAVSWPKERKRGRERVKTAPSRFIAEMALQETNVQEDPRERLRELRAEFTAKVRQQALSRGQA